MGVSGRPASPSGERMPELLGMMPGALPTWAD